MSKRIPRFQFRHPQLAVTYGLKDGRLIVRPRGELDIGNTHRLRSAVSQHLRANDVGVIVNLGDVDFIDSSVVRWLVAWRLELAAKGLDFKAEGASGAVKKVFQAANASDLFRRT